MVAWSRPAQLGGETEASTGFDEVPNGAHAHAEKRARSDDNKVHALFDEVRSASNRLRTECHHRCIRDSVHHDCFTAPVAGRKKARQYFLHFSEEAFRTRKAKPFGGTIGPHPKSLPSIRLALRAVFHNAASRAQGPRAARRELEAKLLNVH